jgi:2-polyprenyl-3-methyl-5-hydroxy-6-metoxy-1,4-benzoquinol methylase
MAEQQQSASLKQLNIDHFNKHGAEVKAHMLALAETTAQHILQHIPLGQDSTVLEFGCGLGLISERLAPAVGSVHGVDIAPNMIEVGGSMSATAPHAACPIALCACASACVFVSTHQPFMMTVCVA